MKLTVPLWLAAIGLMAWSGTALAIEPVPPPDISAPAVMQPPSVQSPDTALSDPLFLPRRVPVRRPSVRAVPFQVQAWAFREAQERPQRGREAFVRDIRIQEIGNVGNTVAMHFDDTFGVQTLTLRTAHPQRSYEVSVRWSDGSWFHDWYKLSYPSGRIVMIQSPRG